MAVVEISQTQGRVPVTVFHLQERVHLGNFSELENMAQKAYENGTRNLVIDMSRTDSMTSIGLRALVVVHKILAKSRPALRRCTTHPCRLATARPTTWISIQPASTLSWAVP